MHQEQVARVEQDRWGWFVGCSMATFFLWLCFNQDPYNGGTIGIVFFPLQLIGIALLTVMGACTPFVVIHSWWEDHSPDPFSENWRPWWPLVWLPMFVAFFWLMS